MKCTNWEPCSEVSINTELRNLREIETNLGECLGADETRYRAAIAQSFLQMAIAAVKDLQAASAMTAPIGQPVQSR